MEGNVWLLDKVCTNVQPSVRVLKIKPTRCTDFSNLFYSKNKFEKIMHLVGFIIRIYHDARSSECQGLSGYKLIVHVWWVPPFRTLTGEFCFITLISHGFSTLSALQLAHLCPRTSCSIPFGRSPCSMLPVLSVITSLLFSLRHHLQISCRRDFTSALQTDDNRLASNQGCVWDDRRSCSYEAQEVEPKT
jgi:hypothetical protein